MKKTLPLLLLFLLASTPFVFGDDNKLKGLKGVMVFSTNDLIPLTEEAVADGFSPEAYKIAVELTLFTRGIPVIDDFSALKKSELPLASILFIEVDPLKFNESVYAIKAGLRLRRVTKFFDGSNWVSSNSEVWSIDGLFVKGLDQVPSLMDDLVNLADDFADAFLEANPPESRSGQGSE